jgi:poly(A) polymerase
MRRIFLLFAAAVLCFGAAWCETATEEKAAGSFYDSEEINRMIDENYAAVLENGYAELRIPLSLHGITEDMLTENSLQVGRTLVENGYKAYVVGGCIRDFIMGKESNDIDISTNATIDQQRALFGDALVTHDVGGMIFGYVQFPDEAVDLATFQNVPAPYAGLPGIPDFDVTTNTSDSEMLDSFQRDMTMNALYYDLSTGDIVDFHGGLYAIREHMIDTMVDPNVQCRNNPSSAIRALRFMAKYNYPASERLDQALKQNGLEFMQLLTPITLNFQLAKFFPDGYARAGYDNLMKYGVFYEFYPVAAELLDRGKYESYCSDAMDFMDKWRKEYGKHSSVLSMAVFLWPVIEDKLSGDLSDKTAYTAAAADILSREEERYELTEEDHEFLTDVLQTEYDITVCGFDASGAPIEKEQAEAMIDRVEFQTAYVLLQIRAQKDEKLSAQVVNWAKLMEQHLED